MKKLIFTCLILVPLSGCMRQSEFSLPIGGGAAGGGSKFMDYWQGKAPTSTTPIQPANQPAVQPANLPATALAESEARRHPKATEEDFREVEGQKESHHGKDPSECIKLLLWFQQHEIKLRLEIKSNPMPGNRKQSLCVFFGAQATVQRFQYNDWYKQSGTSYPTTVNEYPPNPAQYDPLEKPNIKYREDPALYEHGRTLTPEERSEPPISNDQWNNLERRYPSPTPTQPPLSEKRPRPEPKATPNPDTGVDFKPW